MDCNYYKIINGNSFLGVCCSYDFRRFQKKHRILLFCRENEAQYVRCQNDDKLYHDMWMLPASELMKDPYQIASVIQITKDEYDILYNVEEYEIPPEEIEPEEVEEIPVDPVETLTLDYVITNKIKAMKAACYAAITAGFDLPLADGQTMHFSCSTQDQLNLISLASMAASGAVEKYPYHADGELCRYFTAAEITQIVTAMQMLIAKETTYFNSLKAYIMSLDNMEDISAITYGCPVPEEYQSQVYKDLLGGKTDAAQ